MRQISLLHKTRIESAPKSNYIMDFIKEVKTNHSLFLLLLPGVIFVFLMCYLPMIGVFIAFVEYKFYVPNFFLNLLKCDWVWFDNFWLFFNDKYFSSAIRNTVSYNLVFLFFGTVFSLAVALVINELTNRKMAKFYHSTMLLPFFLSWIVFSYVVFAFLGAEHGFINNSILAPLGLNEIIFYNEDKYWPFILFIVNTIRFTGYGSIIYLSAIVGIEPEYFEVARIDGASKWQQITKITLPLISNVVIIMIILNLGSILSADFGLFWNIPLQSPFLRKPTEIVDIYIYRQLQGGKMSISAAAGLFKSIIGFITVLSANLIVRKIDKEKSLF